MADAVHITPSVFEQAGAAVADSLNRAAMPGQAPIAMGGASPADAAAGGVAAAMSAKIAAASAEVAPRGPKIQAASQAAAEGFRAKDEDNATRIAAVQQGLADTPPSSGGAAPAEAAGGPGSSSGAAAGAIRAASFDTGGPGAARSPMFPQSPSDLPTPTPSPGVPQSVSNKPDPAHVPESAIDGVHGTGTKGMPVITAPGELGPANGFGPNTDDGIPSWIRADPEPASPGNNVWLPWDSTQNRLWEPSYPGELAPSNYEEIAPGKWWPRLDPNQ